MRVIYDYQTFEEQQFGGISRYFYELWRHAESCGFEARIAAAYCRNTYLLEDEVLGAALKPWGNAVPSKHPAWFKRIRRRLRLLTRKERQRKANRDSVLTCLAQDREAIFHPTYYDPYFLNALKGRPFVLTVHDMIHECFPEYFQLTNKISLRKLQLCRAATRLIAVSEHTKRDLVEMFGIDPLNVDVIYHANSLMPSNAPLNIQLPKAYLLYNGSRKLYKNFYFFVRAIAGILHTQHMQLVCTGAEFSADEVQFLQLLGIQRHVVHIPANDGVLSALYQHAVAFVFPSLYEGFGIPVLEAFACGCPVILSNLSSLPEVAGDAAAYFDPKNLRSIQDAVQRVISHENVRSDLIARGHERLKRFSWETTAQKTLNVYQKVFNSSQSI